MIIVDTSVRVDYLRGRDTVEARWLDRHVANVTIGLTADLILCEILQGVRDRRVRSRFRKDLASFPTFETGGVHLAVAAAENCRMLRERGRTVRGTIDCLVATFCLRHGDTLLHNDRDYDPFEEELKLAVLHPDL